MFFLLEALEILKRNVM